MPAGQLGQDSDQMHKKKRKSGSRKGGQPGDRPEAPPNSDPAATAKYNEEYEAYLVREYGEPYIKWKASQGFV